jgi:hypothetical protein
MKFKHLSSDAKARIDSLSDQVKKDFSKDSGIDFDALAYHVKKQLSEKGVILEIINTKRCFVHTILWKTNKKALSDIYILNPEIYSRKAQNHGLAHEFGHLLLEHRTRSTETEEAEANYFAKKILGYSIPIMHTFLGVAKYSFLHPIRSYREINSSSAYAIRLIENLEEKTK